MNPIIYNLLREFKSCVAPCVRNRLYSAVATNYVQGKDNSHPESAVKTATDQSNDKETTKSFTKLSEFRFIFPEFLSNPNFRFRHKIKDKLERLDMLKRRSVINIPEFYVGSVLAVTATDPYAPGKKKKFVGICVQRTYTALLATFTLRNIVDGQGVEIMYDMYNPTILSIDVLKLEKRLDEELFYLRDAYPEYSTFDFDMEPEFHPEGAPVPINPLKVKLKPLPWHVKWEQKNMKGIESTAEAPFKRQWTARDIQTPWEKYDLMKEYRRCITEEEQLEIWQDVDAHKHKFPIKQHVWKRNLLKAKPK